MGPNSLAIDSAKILWAAFVDAKNPQCDFPLVDAVFPVTKILPFFSFNILGNVSLTRYNKAVVFTLKFTSKSFLQQQVRSMVGCIKYLGDEKWSLEDFKNSFKFKSRLKCAPPAPACGLYLKRVTY